MVKDHFEKELQIPATQQRDGNTNSPKEVRKIQSWLSLHGYQTLGLGTNVVIDGDFGPATERAVKLFQTNRGMSDDGQVTPGLFQELCAPIRQAFTMPSNKTDLRSRIVAIAHQHLAEYPRELTIRGESNSGPWVRAYMDGKQGAEWLWCVGFIQAIIDQAASEMGLRFTKYMPKTYSCDTVGNHAIQRETLTRNEQWRNDPDLAEPGDVFLSRKSRFDWVHVGIIVNVTPEYIETIEGNTNDGGSRNGYAVFKRIRNIKKSRLDLYSIRQLVAASTS